MDHEVQYDRNLTGSYMKIRTDPEGKYDEKILLKGKKKGLLPMEISFYDGQPWYWYDISGKQSLDTYCRICPLDMAVFRRIILSIFDEMEIMEWNLLSSEILVLDPEYIFISNLSGEVIFTGFPGYGRDVSKQLQELVEYLLTKLDHSDVKAVKAAYGIYEKTLDEAYSIADLRKLLVEVCPSEGSAVPGNSVYEKKDECSRESIRKTKDNVGDESGAGRMVQERDKQEENDNAALDTIKKHSFLIKIKEFLLQKAEEDEKVQKFIEYKKMLFPGKDTKKQKKKEKKTERPMEDNVVYPQDAIREEMRVVHPTVCIAAYREHPQGMLLYEGGDHLDNIHIAKDTVMKVGKAEEADILIRRETISRFHASLISCKEEFFVEDLNSTNGTYVNETPLAYKERRKLNFDDIVRFADVRYRFV